MINPTPSPIILLISRLLARLIQLFAIYVILHGHYSPGGGFQGGALLASSVLLLRLSEGRTASQPQFQRRWGVPLGAAGALIFAGLGLVVMLAGGQYLDYEAVLIPGMDPAEVRSLGILVVEIGVALAVMATLVSIFDDLLEEDPDG
jgi:multicomponent Na+:H+ antiporter subunit B